MWESTVNSFLLVAAAEMGDKTQLLAFVLAARFKKPWAVMGGIFAASVLSHFLAAWIGVEVAQALPAMVLKWILALIFFGFAIWVLIPEKRDEKTQATSSHLGAFLTTFLAFLMAEMGDKTQLATVALAAKYQDVFSVTVGSSLGMFVTDGLAVFFGERLTRRIPIICMHRLAALLYVIFGALIILNI